jgi:uncharacterized protein (DUF1330 family)
MVALSTTALEAFLAEQDDTPVVMLNLIRLQPDGGRDRYLEYLSMAKPILARFGAKILFGGDGLTLLTEGLVKAWDVVALVQYPRHSAFMEMVADPEYQGVFEVGVSAIADIVLQPLKHIDGLV